MKIMKAPIFCDVASVVQQMFTNIKKKKNCYFNLQGRRVNCMEKCGQ
jgi:hypothetical protein